MLDILIYLLVFGFIITWVMSSIILNKLDSITELIKQEKRKENDFKKNFLIALGWKRYNNQLWYRINNELWSLDDAYTVALRESKKSGI